MGKIFVLHENDAWLEPLRRAFAEQGLLHEEWFLDEGRLDLSQPPPEGIFYNRMSASAFTRGHQHSAQFTGAVLAWLEGYGRRVVNNSRALQLELSKAAQYGALNAHGVRTPRTVVVAGRELIVPTARESWPQGPLILKPNRGGKGHGVQLYQSIEALRAYVESDAYEAPVDGISLLQEYIAAPEPYIVRAEFIGGRFFYAVRVNTSQGFELCPADVCAVEDAEESNGSAAVSDADGTQAQPGEPMFRVLEGFGHPILKTYEAFLAANGIEIAGIEFITDGAGDIYTYDVNTNTNYNPEAEAAAGKFGMAEVARFLGEQLFRQSGLPLHPGAEGGMVSDNPLG
ncbi:MAG: alpha-L-glutamate ligase [SAR324 cluster bacterium]|nr:alpha-L-glutamate ligase [SAR324 cluster bacterium]